MWRSTAVGVVLPLHCLMETSREKIINSVPKTRKKEWNWSVLFLSDFDTINLKKKHLHLSQLSVNYQGENTIKIYCSRQLPFSPLQEALAQSPVPAPKSIGETDWLSLTWVSHHKPNRKLIESGIHFPSPATIPPFPWAEAKTKTLCYSLPGSEQRSHG